MVRRDGRGAVTPSPESRRGRGDEGEVGVRGWWWTSCSLVKASWLPVCCLLLRRTVQRVCARDEPRHQPVCCFGRSQGRAGPLPLLSGADHSSFRSLHCSDRRLRLRGQAMLTSNGSRKAVTQAVRATGRAHALPRPARTSAAWTWSFVHHLHSSPSAQAVGSLSNWPIRTGHSSPAFPVRQSSSHAASSDPAIRLAQLTLDAESQGAAQTELDTLDPSSAEYAQRAKALSDQRALQEVWKSWKDYERVSRGAFIGALALI